MGKRFKRDELKKELLRIKKNNSSLNENILFKSSLYYSKETDFKLTPQEINDKNKKPKYLLNMLQADLTWSQTKEVKSFIVKHFIKIKKLEAWRKSKKDSQQGFNDDYIIRNFTSFEKDNKEFNKLIKSLEIQKKLIKKDFIDKFTYGISTDPVKQSITDYNKIYYDEKKDWFSENQELQKILWDSNERKKFTSKYWKGSRLSDKLIVELLMRGDQEIKIFYQEFEVDITDKGLEYLNNGWLSRHWKWIVTTGVSIIALIFSVLVPIILKIYLK